MAAIKPKMREDLALAEVGPEAVVYDPRTAQIHYLSPEASAIFRLFDGTATMKETATDIADVLERPVAEVERQVRTLHKEFRNAQLLEGSFVPDADGNGAGPAGAEDERPKVRAEVPRSS